MRQNSRMIQLEDYVPFIGERTVERIRKKAENLRHLHVAHVNSTYYGGGWPPCCLPLRCL